jgi:hypothetical protein
LNRYKASTLAETNGIGNMPYKELKKLYPNVQDFATTNKSKQNIIQKLIMDFEQDSLKIPDNNELKTELDCFELKVSKAGNVCYSARQGFNDDIVMSLAMANKNRGIGYSGVGTATLNSNTIR